MGPPNVLIRPCSPVVKEKVYGGKDLLKSQVLSSEWNTERVSGDSEDGKDDELQCHVWSGCHLPKAIRKYGECFKLPSEVWNNTPAAQMFRCIYNLQNWRLYMTLQWIWSVLEVWLKPKIYISCLLVAYLLIIRCGKRSADHSSLMVPYSWWAPALAMKLEYNAGSIDWSLVAFLREGWHNSKPCHWVAPPSCDLILSSIFARLLLF